MAQYSAINEQTVAVNHNVVFDVTSCNVDGVDHRIGSGLFTLHGGKTYLIGFSANIAVPTEETAGEIALALGIAGEQIQATRMEATPTDTDAFFNIATLYEIKVPCCCCYNVTVENVSTIPVTVANANLVIRREG